MLTSNNDRNIVAIIEARMTSSRLPGKVLLPADGILMLKHLITRLEAVPGLQSIVLATTVNGTDDPLVVFAKQENLNYYRGSEDDVMMRVIQAAESTDAEVVVEITGECPIIEPDIVEQTIRMYLVDQADYVSNCCVRSYPDGIDTQVINLDRLKRSVAMTNDLLDHEHVTLHIRNHPEIFSLEHLVALPELYWPELGLTLDEEDDYKLLKQINEDFEIGNRLFLYWIQFVYCQSTAKQSLSNN